MVTRGSQRRVVLLGGKDLNLHVLQEVLGTEAQGDLVQERHNAAIWNERVKAPEPPKQMSLTVLSVAVLLVCLVGCVGTIALWWHCGTVVAL